MIKGDKYFPAEMMAVSNLFESILGSYLLLLFQTINSTNTLFGS